MNIRTVLQIKNHYPENILIQADKRKNGKWASYMYFLKDGEIHSLILSFSPNFNTKKLAIEAMKEVAQRAIDYKVDENVTK